MALEAYCDSLTTPSRRPRRLRTRYEDLWLATAVRGVQREWLTSTTDSEWADPRVKASLLAWTKLELARQTLELARLRRWLSSGVRRKAEERARERFLSMAAEIPTELPTDLLRVDEISPPESVPGGPTGPSHAIYERLQAQIAAAGRAAPVPAARALAAGVKRLRGALWFPAAIRGEPSARIRSGLAGVRRHTPLAVAISVFAALAVLIGLTGLPFEGPAGHHAGPTPNRSVGEQGNAGAVKVATAPRSAALETVATAGGSQTPGYLAAAPVSSGTHGLVVALSAWLPPTVLHVRDCSDFGNQRGAQRWFNRHHPRRDPFGLDGDHDGVACERDPCPCSHLFRRRAHSGAAQDSGPGGHDRRVAGEHAPPAAAGTPPSGTTAPIGPSAPSGRAASVGPVSVSVPQAPVAAPAPAPAPPAPVSQPVRSLNRAVGGTGVHTGVPHVTRGLTGGLDHAAGNAGHTVKRVTGGLLGN